MKTGIPMKKFMALKFGADESSSPDEALVLAHAYEKGYEACQEKAARMIESLSTDSKITGFATLIRGMGRAEVDMVTGKAIDYEQNQEG